MLPEDAIEITNYSYWNKYQSYRRIEIIFRYPYQRDYYLYSVYHQYLEPEYKKYEEQYETIKKIDISDVIRLISAPLVDVDGVGAYYGYHDIKVAKLKDFLEKLLSMNNVIINVFDEFEDYNFKKTLCKRVLDKYIDNNFSYDLVLSKEEVQLYADVIISMDEVWKEYTKNYVSTGDEQWQSN